MELAGGRRGAAAGRGTACRGWRIASRGWRIAFHCAQNLPSSAVGSDIPLFLIIMKNSILVVVSAMLLSAFTVAAKEDAPRGFSSLSEMKDVQAKAAADKKLVVLVVKGLNDSCPYCAAALANGVKAVGSGVIKVFARAETIGKADASAFTEAFKARAQQPFTMGAAVTFVVFDPEMNQIVAEAGRQELESNKKSIAAFKEKVQEAKKALK